MGKVTAPPAVVMNMYYTGLGIARSLGEHGIPVIGLSAQRGLYGNFTRYAKVVACPDSRTEPEALLNFLLRMAETFTARGVLFPTRDDDVVFLDRFRERLEPHFVPAIPERRAVEICLNKWQTDLCAQRAGIATPKCWMVGGEEDLERVLGEVSFPCVLKPLAAYHWRQGGNWATVGARKAIAVFSRQELLAEYAVVARAERRALLQELVPGGDDALAVAACCLDRNSNWVAGFNARKLVQMPEGFGTGCIVENAHHPELLAASERLLRSMGFTGIAEVEYKWDSGSGQYKLIEINPRPWDQHRLGRFCGADLVYLAYCEYAGVPARPARKRAAPHKWIAEDAFIMASLRMIWRRDSKIRSLFRLARGKRTYAIASIKDPVPIVAYVIAHLIPMLVSSALQAFRTAFRKLSGKSGSPKHGLAYGKDNSHG